MMAYAICITGYNAGAQLREAVFVNENVPSYQNMKIHIFNENIYFKSFSL